MHFVVYIDQQNRGNNVEQASQYTYYVLPQWNVETYGYIVVPRTNQVRVRAGISWKFRDIQFEELPPCNVHF